MKEKRTIYICDKCGKESVSSYCIMEVHLPWDLSVAGQEYHFCEDCYKEIRDIMKDKDQVAVPLSKIKEELKKLIDDAPEKQYVPISYPIYYYYPKDWYPKVRYTTTITGSPKEGTSISANRGTNDVTVCCCDSERRI